MAGLSLTLIILTLAIFTIKAMTENNPPVAEAQAMPPDVPNHNVGGTVYPHPANPESPIPPYLDESANPEGHT